MWFSGMVTITTSPLRAARSTETAVAPVSAAERAQRLGSARVGDEDLVPELTEPAGQRAADMSCTDDSDLHGRPPPSTGASAVPTTRPTGGGASAATLARAAARLTFKLRSCAVEEP